MKKIFVSGVFILTLIGTGVVAHAATLASGALSGGPGATVAACYIFNAGTDPITFKDPRIQLHAQFAPPSSSFYYDDCGATLAAGAICGIGVSILDNQGYACSVHFIGDKGTVRGVMEIRDATGRVMANSELR